MIISIESYLGSEGEELPRAFCMGKRRIPVLDIADRWLSHDHSYFKVLTEDNATYILRHDKIKNIWEMTVFNSIYPY